MWKWVSPVNRSSPNRLDAAHWLALWEQCSQLPPQLAPCALLASVRDADAEATEADATDDALHPERWPLGRRDAALLDLTAALFGPALTAATRCPACGEQIDLSLSTEQLRVASMASTASAPSAPCGSISAAGWQVDWRLPNSLDLAAAGAAGSAQAAQHTLLQRCVQRATCQGVAVDRSEFAADLPPMLVQQLAAEMAAADPQALTELALQCPACTHAWTEVFDIGAFLLQRLAHWAETTLDQVHTLACAYGWTEAETLRLSPARRAHYLARVLA